MHSRRSSRVAVEATLFMSAGEPIKNALGAAQSVTSTFGRLVTADRSSFKSLSSWLWKAGPKRCSHSPKLTAQANRLFSLNRLTEIQAVASSEPPRARCGQTCQTARMKQPNQQQLRALRLTALARDSQVVADLNASIADTPDSLVKELMDTHGWPAHEALSAVQQLQEKALRDTYEQAAA